KVTPNLLYVHKGQRSDTLLISIGLPTKQEVLREWATLIYMGSKEVRRHTGEGCSEGISDIS
ncbi:MAG: hypothetical protein JSW05_08145, partial [Candidatus Thorarchaeota archaeon]